MRSDGCFKKFYSDFREATTSEIMDALVDTEVPKMEDLISQGISDPTRDIEKWRIDIRDLRDNQQTLERAFFQHKASELPIDYTNGELLLEMQQDLLQAARSRERHAKLDRLVEDAILHRDLNMLTPTCDHQQDLKQRLQNGRLQIQDESGSKKSPHRQFNADSLLGFAF